MKVFIVFLFYSLTVLEGIEGLVLCILCLYFDTAMKMAWQEKSWFNFKTLILFVNATAGISEHHKQWISVSISAV